MQVTNRMQRSATREGGARSLIEVVNDVQNDVQLRKSMKNDKSLFIFKRQCCIRKTAICLTDNKCFEIFILCVILANCIVLALAEHLPNNDKTKRTMELEKSEVYFLSIFTVEAALKIISQGFIIGKTAYLKDHWNKLDFLLVILGLLEYCVNIMLKFNFTLLRLTRVLRAIRFVSKIQKMRGVAMTIFRSVSLLVPVFVLVIMTMIIFAILGMNYYKGAFNRTCFNSDYEMQCHEKKCHPKMVESRPCQEDREGTGHHCTENSTCSRYWVGPNEGITSFNNIGVALLTVFQCLTMEGWTDLYYFTNDAKGISWNWLYFIPLVVFCAFFMMNIVLGILKGVFTREREKMEREQKTEKTEYLNEKRQMQNCFKWINKGEEIECREQSALPRQLPRNVLKDIDKKISEVRFLRVRRLVESECFFWATMMCVFANTVIAATEHYNQPQWLESVQYYMEIVFVALYAIEILLRICAHGCRQYFFSKFNIFDTVVLLASILELAIRILCARKHGLKCSVFRAMRLLQVFKKTKYNDDIEKLLQVLIGSISYVLSLMFILFLFLFMFALFGMELFGGRFNFNEGRPEAHFDSFTKAMLTVFQILTGEDWNVVMYNGVKAHGGIDGIGALVVFYFITIVLFGNYMLLNILFAIAVDSLAEAKRISDSEKTKIKEMKGSTVMDKEAAHEKCRSSCNINPDRNLLVFGKNNKFRKKVHKLVIHDRFEKLVLICIILSSITLALEDPTKEHNSVRNEILFWVDAVFAFIFTIEMILKLIDIGLVLHKGSYLRDRWNFMDGVIVIASIASLFISDSSAKTLKVFRVLRVLRILRTIKRFPGLKKACVMFLKSIQSVGPLISIYVLLHVTFSIMAVQLMNGRLFYCTDLTKMTRDQCRGTFFQYTEANFMTPKISKREWKRRDFHFDNVGAAISTLFVITSGEGWPYIVHTAVSSTGVDKGPKDEVNPEISVFFVVYMTIAPFFFLNVFIAMITVAFQTEDTNKNICGLTTSQENCIRYVVEAEPVQMRFISKDASKLRKLLWKVIISDHFENVVILFVILNTICLAMEYQDQSEAYTFSLQYSNLVFVVAFVLETVLKMFVLRKKYFSDNWNRMDLFLVLGSVVDTTLDLLKSLPYVIILNLLLFYVFAVLGMQIFGNIGVDDETSITKYNNFGNILTSLLVLFRCATGENWQNVMLDCLSGRPCESGGASCGTDGAYFYFIVFICLSSFLMMNLFEAVIVENFNYLHRDPSELGPHHLETFTDLWHKYASLDDPNTMEVKHLEDFVKSMDPPLGFGRRCPRTQMQRNFLRMNTSIDENLHVHFVSVMFDLVSLALGIHSKAWRNENYENLRTVLKGKLNVDSDKLKLMLPDTEPKLSLRQFAAVQSWKKWTRKKASSATRRKSSLSKRNPISRLIDSSRKRLSKAKQKKNVRNDENSSIIMVEDISMIENHSMVEINSKNHSMVEIYRRINP
ncbi:voltage-dependent P/Q-type calcium channel subunit alpha-1A-like isoform X2 [Ostrea edulis]|uniref:voltage-dependent P/Q-type calcium channel subunit alpha-1A-like isoform X2 n=1 Tax=Ostrea edulis TaxID=37623 RepID=UPI0024AF1C09|nr:voltage-dependent P/Q-type calcium channel subunit alpha-1A-like isoform X2 [Ostrea edulis]